MDPPVLAARDDSNTTYGYIPTKWICILFIVLFGLSTFVHAVEAVYSRLWWLFGTACVAGILEIVGWSGRLWSSINPSSLSPYIMQMTTTIIAPTPLVAANFVILGQMIRRLGQCYSRLSAMWYTIIFCSFDVIALIIQAVGGASAANAVNSNNNPAKGGRIMLGGIAFQLAAITIYIILAAEFVLRFLYNRPLRSAESTMTGYGLDRNMKLMLLGLAFSSLVIYIRSVYRTIELANGWTGRIIKTQVYFNVLDGAMITLAMYTLNVLHPGFLLGPSATWRGRAPTDLKPVGSPEPQEQEADRLSEKDQHTGGVV
ncbi:hypothetical protein AcV7_007655 [Taiwanofungus camphoratus]|nr:hypothetical protein AcV7_007655 [Antrodia cinnamomea]